jgi:uncharacterized protein YgbK (DUF1537 family)
MPPRPHIVLADDLTGAAEIAASARQAGRRALVLTCPPEAPVDADVLVLDTGTRLATPAFAARRLRALVALLARIPNAGFFLKVDSVLRGPVLGQIAGATRALGLSRALLVPANPSLGRIILNGRYFVGGVPLHETAFAHDPHHPRTTSEALALLGRAPRLSLALCTTKCADFSSHGVVFGEASTADDIRYWAGCLSADILPVGGVDFFRAWLGVRARKPARQPALRLYGPALLLHGTTATPADAEALFFKARRAPSVATISAHLSLHGAAIVAAPAGRLTSPDAPAAISREFARVAVALKNQNMFQHLLIAGGATAADVLPALGWTTLEVLRVWGPGVVTLRPLAEPNATVTLKPGSYAWPTELRDAMPSELFN